MNEWRNWRADGALWMSPSGSLWPQSLARRREHLSAAMVRNAE